MIVDCTMYFQEAEALEIRLRELAPVVDLFVIVEARQTFQGIARTPRLRDDLAARGLPDVPLHYVVLDSLPGGSDPWVRETAQRDAMATAIPSCVPDDAIILLSDVDEIPAAASLPAALAPGERFRICQEGYQLALNLQVIWSAHWHGTQLVRRDDLRTTTPQQLRTVVHPDTHEPRDRPGGWHFSWLGTPADNWAKSIAWSHGPSREWTEAHWERAHDDLITWGKTRNDMPRLLRPGRDWLPAYVQEHPERFSLLEESV